MSTSEIVLSKEARTELKEFSAEQFQTQMLSGEINNAQKAFFVACLGMELGLSPMQSLRSIYVIKGKPVLSAAAIQAIVVRRKDVCEYLMLVESTHEKATYETKRVGDPGPTKLTWTIQMAQRAGLLNNPTWKAHPEAMLRARCVAALCRAVFPDLAMGLYEESEGEEIRGETRFVQGTSGDPNLGAHLEGRRFSVVPEPAQLPATELHPAFAPEPSELDSTVIGQIAAAVAAINACATLDALKQHAAVLKENPLSKPDSASRQTLLDAYAKRRTELTEYAALLAEAAKPDADKPALLTRSLALTGLSPEQEQAIAKALS